MANTYSQLYVYLVFAAGRTQWALAPVMTCLTMAGGSSPLQNGEGQGVRKQEMPNLSCN
jgi:hypothetical protein